MRTENEGNEKEDDEEINNDSNIQLMYYRIRSVLTNKTYLLMCGALTFLYYLLAGVQYWISDYLITVLKQDEEIVFPTFAVISITGPVLGVVVGGNITTALGGYNSPKSLRLMCLISFFAIGSSIPVPFLDNFTLVVILVWCLLFAGGFILPTITGIMLNQVEKDQKTTANSIANFSYNMLGYLPSPFIYGLIVDKGNARVAMGTLMSAPTLATAMMWIGCYIIMRDDLLPKQVPTAP